MKMVVIAYNEALDSEVMKLLKTHGQSTYTKWTKVLGQGERSEPHLLTHIWPKANNVIMICTEDNKAIAIMTAVREARNAYSHEGIKAFSMPLDDVT